MAPRYLLDTNTASFIIRGALQERLAALSPADLAISAITEGELLFGLARKPDAAALHRKVHSFLLHVVVLPWDSEAARHYGPLRGQLEAAGQPLGALDLLIAAHALAAGCILVTNDRAFARVDGLVVEDWLAA